MTPDDKSESDEYLRGRIANLRKMAMVCREEAKSAKAPNSVISLSVTDEALRKRFAASTEYLEILDAAKGAIEVASQIAKLEDKPESCLLAYHPYLAADPAYSNVAHALRRLETQEKIVAILRSPPIRIDERWEASLNAWATPEETTSMERATFAIRMTSKIAGADWPNNPAKRNAQIKSDLADDLRYARMDLDSVKYDLTAAAESCPIGLEILKQEPCHAAATTALNSRLQSLHALSSRHHEVVAEYVEQENRRRINEAKKFESMAYDLEARLERRQKEREEAERAEARAREERKRQAKIQAERDLGPRAYLENRGVPCLLHFTRTAYLPAILREGLLSRAELEHRHPRTRFNDLQRLDGEPDTISCSIGHPNAATLHRFRERAGPDTWWCIIAIKLAVLDQQPALFCLENAAATGVVADARRRSGMGDHARALFGDINCKHGRVMRDSLGLEARLPTHPQAEVLVAAPILPEFTIGACFPDLMGLNWAKQKSPRDFVLEVSPGMFRSRRDWKHWLGENHG